MGDQVVVLLDNNGSIQKVLMCRDKTHDDIVREVQTRWGNVLINNPKLVIANVVSVEQGVMTFSTGGWLNLSGGAVLTKE